MPLTSYHERDLAIGRHAVMAEAFELLADHLGPFIDERMVEYFCNEPSWADAAANRLGRPAEHGATDPLFQLLVLRRFWGPVFADFYGQDLRQIVGQLIETRNMWAHFSFPDDPDALQRSVLAIERLLAPVEPGVTGRLRRLRAQVYDPDRDLDENGVDASSEGQSNDGETGAVETGAVETAATGEGSSPPSAEQAGDRNGDRTGDSELDDSGARSETNGSVQDVGSRSTGDGAVPFREQRSPRPQRRRDDVDVSHLKAQLSETEIVFKELQDRYGDLQNELSNTRRITASKQLRLTAVEQRLLEAKDHSTAVEEDLKEERITRNHIEWLIVALIATLLLFMVLANT